MLVDYFPPGICVFISLLPLSLRLTIISHHLYDTLEDFSNAITLYSTSAHPFQIQLPAAYSSGSQSASIPGGALQHCKNSNGVTRSEFNILQAALMTRAKGNLCTSRSWMLALAQLWEGIAIRNWMVNVTEQHVEQNTVISHSRQI